MTTVQSIAGLTEIIASREELQHFSDDVWALAYALAIVFQQPQPTAEQCTYFIDDAEACAGDVGPGPYTVTKLAEATGSYTAVVVINNWLCGAEEGEGFIELSTIANLTGWAIAHYEPCKSAKGWGECVLADGHETRESDVVGGRPTTSHVDRNGQHWGVTAGGN